MVEGPAKDDVEKYIGKNISVIGEIKNGVLHATKVEVK
jgi:hypothetical protein